MTIKKDQPVNQATGPQAYNPVKFLLSKGATNAKTAKNEIETFILYLAPADTVAGFNLCPFASPGCKSSCLYKAGRGAFSNVQLSRINKTKFWAFDRANFYIQLTNEILKISDRAKHGGEKIAIRLNGTSDIPHIELIERFTGVNFLSPGFSHLLFYDYTKNAKQALKYAGTNYRVTFSLSETNRAEALQLLAAGVNVAAVFDSLPDNWSGYPVINGDLTDLRYFDPAGVIVGLKAKGPARKDLTGFVIKTGTQCGN